MASEDHAWELLMARVKRIEDAGDRLVDTVSQILLEVKKTNGRVTTLEEEKRRGTHRLEWLIASACVIVSGSIGEIFHLLHF